MTDNIKQLLADEEEIALKAFDVSEEASKLFAKTECVQLGDLLLIVLDGKKTIWEIPDDWKLPAGEFRHGMMMLSKLYYDILLSGELELHVQESIILSDLGWTAKMMGLLMKSKKALSLLAIYGHDQSARLALSYSFMSEIELLAVLSMRQDAIASLALQAYEIRRLEGFLGKASFMLVGVNVLKK